MALFLAGLAGCASMTETDCRDADWAQIGTRDGLSGGPPRIEVYAYQCGRHDVRAAEKDYMDGWWAGHADFVQRADTMEGAM